MAQFTQLMVAPDTYALKLNYKSQTIVKKKSETDYCQLDGIHRT